MRGVLSLTLLGVYGEKDLLGPLLALTTLGIGCFLLWRQGAAGLSRGVLAASVVFLGAIALATFSSLEKALSIPYFVRYAGYLAAFWLPLLLRPNRREVQELASWLVILGLAMAVVGLYFYWSELGEISHPSMTALFGNKNHAAGYWGLILPVALALYWTAQGGRAVRAYGASTLLLCVALFLTFSRGGWIAIAVGLAVLLFGLARGRAVPWRSWALRTAVVLVLSALTVSLVRGAGLGRAFGTGSQAVAAVAVATTGGPATDTLAPRLNYWRGALSIFLDYTWLGTGPGTFARFFPRYQPQSEFFSRFAHNFPLQTAAEMGALGLGATAIFFGTVTVAAVRKLRRLRATDLYPLALALAAGLLASTLHNLVELDWYIATLGLLFYAQLGLLLALPEPAPEEVRSAGPAGSLTKGEARLLLAATLLLLAITLWSYGTQLALALGDRAREREAWNQALSHYRTASHLQPWSGEGPYRIADLLLERSEKEQGELPLEEGLRWTALAIGRGPENIVYRAIQIKYLLTGVDLGHPWKEVAYEALRELTARSPAHQSALAYRRLGTLALELEQFQAAERVFEEILATYPEGLETPQPQYMELSPQELMELLAEAHLGLGKLAFREEAWEEARHHFATATELLPEHAPARFNLGVATYLLGRYGEAMQALQAATGLDPTYAPSHYYLSRAALAQGEQEVARRSLALALSLDPANPEYRQAWQALQGDLTP